MRDLWLIKSDIVDRYKDGDDWVYAKGKKTEIELIKELMEVCTDYAQKVHELEKELAVVDKWEAYQRADYKLDEVRHAFEMWTFGLQELEQSHKKYDEALTALKESEKYMKSVRDRLLGKEENQHEI